MEHNHSATMSQKIFKLSLDMETISIYLLCCGLVDAGETLSIKNLKGIWNGSQETLVAGLNDLTGHGIIRQVMAHGADEVIYRLNEENRWHQSSGLAKK